MVWRESLKTWLVKHVVSPVDRASFRITGGRLRLTIGRPVLLLSTVGRRTGIARRTPVFYIRDGANLVVSNVAASFLAREGRGVINVLGGMTAWEAAELPTE